MSTFIEEFKQKGYRVFPITKIIPDAIFVKDGKVIAFELELKYDKEKIKDKE